MDGSLRLMGGEAGAAFEYGRLEVFLRGFWSNVCSTEVFTPDSAAVACRALGYDGGASLQFLQPFRFLENNQVQQSLIFSTLDGSSVLSSHDAFPAIGII